MCMIVLGMQAGGREESDVATVVNCDGVASSCIKFVLLYM